MSTFLRVMIRLGGSAVVLRRGHVHMNANPEASLSKRFHH